MTEATEKIAKHDLGFEVADCGQDEFGRLCRSFEEMRKELVKMKQSYGGQRKSGNV